MARTIASVTQKYVSGIKRITNRIMKEEAQALHSILSNKSGKFWAYDSKRNYNQHSQDFFHWDVVKNGDTIKAVVWNDKPLADSRGFNYVAAIAHKDLSEQTKSEDYEYLVKAMKDSIKDRIKKEIKGKL